MDIRYFAESQNLQERIANLEQANEKLHALANYLKKSLDFYEAKDGCPLEKIKSIIASHLVRSDRKSSQKEFDSLIQILDILN